MSSRIIVLVFIFSLVCVIIASNKNKIDPSLPKTTAATKNEIVRKKDQVDKTKKKSTKLKPTLCKLPRDVGPCRAAIDRFYYDSIANECKAFTYGGCQGNQNNFRSLNKCQKTCKF
ncbi:unnamed protein product [Adineta ricciae]|uniref:BPTI/Kunitz inhibitor domain-containing protein n=1 Tax=Adineta ricciae TaxID=249248 RepID=A0A814CYA2_ADIRI|nr:unnamed protein product [Adineta ricciae]CAF0949689.1 unnamed protein product [Adineta ricciae]